MTRDADELRDVGGGQPFDAEDRQRQQRVLTALPLTTNAVSRAADPASQPIVRAEPQPTAGARTSA